MTKMIDTCKDYMCTAYQIFGKCNKIVQITFVTTCIHWIATLILYNYCIPHIRNDTTFHWIIDSGYSMIIHPLKLGNPICVGCTYYMTKMSELFITTWYISVIGLISQLYQFAGGGFEKIKNLI